MWDAVTLSEWQRIEMFAVILPGRWPMAWKKATSDCNCLQKDGTSTQLECFASIMIRIEPITMRQK